MDCPKIWFKNKRTWPGPPPYIFLMWWEDKIKQRCFAHLCQNKVTARAGLSTAACRWASTLVKPILQQGELICPMLWYLKTFMLSWYSQRSHSPPNIWPHGSQCWKLQWFDGKTQRSIRDLIAKNPKTSLFYECKIKDFPQSVESVFSTCSTFFQKSLSLQVEIIIITMLPVENLSIHFRGKAAILICLETWNCVC